MLVALSDAEYELYEKYLMQERDDRGMLVKAREEGHTEGHAEGHAEGRAEGEEERRQEAEAREAAETQLREAMAEIQRLKGTSPDG
jgi:flagellar biosynthesis/type III secretory pathway protein FliH